uniref:Uncharacterized protein n=1 Tax=Tetraselmis chuii TaxID=63592 RepID=A0A6U1EUZ7_9CHLO|mmetsp:Transcript_15366/g.27202  ORF Transcript_15366/g.27202 Transcript_15366/m.27202 type:complete len:335 (+) Transcript_15366:535-1539(+)
MLATHCIAFQCCNQLACWLSPPFTATGDALDALPHPSGDLAPLLCPRHERAGAVGGAASDVSCASSGSRQKPDTSSFLFSFVGTDADAGCPMPVTPVVGPSKAFLASLICGKRKESVPCIDLVSPEPSLVGGATSADSQGQAQMMLQEWSSLVSENNCNEEAVSRFWQYVLGARISLAQEEVGRVRGRRGGRVIRFPLRLLDLGDASADSVMLPQFRKFVKAWHAHRAKIITVPCHLGSSFEAVLEPVVFNSGTPNAEAAVFCGCGLLDADGRHCLSIGGGLPCGIIISRTSPSAWEGHMRSRTHQRWAATQNGLLYVAVRHKAEKKDVMSVLS